VLIRLAADQAVPPPPPVSPETVRINLAALRRRVLHYRDRWLGYDRRLAVTPLDPPVYAAVARYALDCGQHVCTAGRRTVAAIVGCAASALDRVLRRLAAAGLITAYWRPEPTKHGLRWRVHIHLHAAPQPRTPAQVAEIVEFRAPALLRGETLHQRQSQLIDLAEKFDETMGLTNSSVPEPTMRPRGGQNPTEFIKESLPCNDSALRSVRESQPQPGRQWSRGHVTGPISVAVGAIRTVAEQLAELRRRIE
jgi:hypothetical protein